MVSKSLFFVNICVSFLSKSMLEDDRNSIKILRARSSKGKILCSMVQLKDWIAFAFEVFYFFPKS